MDIDSMSFSSAVQQLGEYFKSEADSSCTKHVEVISDTEVTETVVCKSDDSAEEITVGVANEQSSVSSMVSSYVDTASEDDSLAIAGGWGSHSLRMFGWW